MKRTILSLSNTIDQWMKRITTVFLVALVCLVLLQVVARYIFFSPPAWTEELSRYAMIWTGLLGATMSFKQRFDPALFSGSTRTQNHHLNIARSVIQSVTVLIYLLPILWYCFFGSGMQLTRGFLFRHTKISAETIDFPTFVVAISVPIAMFTILLHLAARWAGDDAEYKNE